MAETDTDRLAALEARVEALEAAATTHGEWVSMPRAEYDMMLARVDQLLHRLSRYHAAYQRGDPRAADVHAQSAAMEAALLRRLLLSQPPPSQGKPCPDCGGSGWLALDEATCEPCAACGTTGVKREAV